MKPKSSPDYILLAITGAIILFGLFILASVVTVTSEANFVSQIVMGLFPGAIIAFLLYKTPFHLIEKWSPVFLLFTLFLVALLFIPFLAETRGGATRWLSFGNFLSFQPAEFLKLAFILYVSSWLIAKNQKKKTRNSFKETLLPFGAICGLLAFLLLKQPDFSTLSIIIFTGCVIYFTANTPLWHSIVIFLGGGLGGYLAVRIADYRLERIISVFDPSSDPLGASYQINQALTAIGSGGLFGLGFGMSQQKFGFLPHPGSDSIFAVLAEETGFIGGIILITLFLLFFWRGFLIAKNGKNNFARLVALGICTWIFIQTSVNIGAMVGILPITGIPLPFISYGKSHLIVEMAALGILLNASQYKE